MIQVKTDLLALMIALALVCGAVVVFFVFIFIAKQTAQVNSKLWMAPTPTLTITPTIVRYGAGY